MKIVILAAGKPALGYAKEGVQFYLNRLKPFTHIELKLIKDGSSGEVSSRLLAASEGYLRIAMDERGELLTTHDLTRQLQTWQLQSVGKLAFLIGTAEGHTPILRSQCDKILALSKFTLQHELALVMLLEQIYRCHTIMAHTPYHR